MSIYVLSWIKEDLELEGKSIKDYRLIDIKKMLIQYNLKFGNKK